MGHANSRAKLGPTVALRPAVKGAGLVLAIFIVFQVSDGLMTYMAVQAFGIQAEGNPLLVTWMHLAGPGHTLLGAKILACACGVLLYARGVVSVLALLTLLYLWAAIIPWLHVLST
jgi:hypothetical protein